MMKNIIQSFMKMSARIPLTLVLGVALFAVNGYSAEEKPKPPRIFNEADVEAAWQRRIPDLRIDGLPLSEVARYLRQREYFPEVNFIVPISAREAMVQSIDLRSVTLDDILTAIELASEGHIRTSVHGEQVASVDAAGLPVVKRAVTSPTNLVAFTFIPPPTPADKDQNWPVCRVFSLAPYLAYKSEEEAERAINSLYQVLEYAWQMLGKQVRVVQRPELNIHSGTKLLIAVGGERELAVVEQVIKELQGSAPTRTVAAPTADEKRWEELKRALQQLEKLKPNAANTDAPPAKP